VNQYLGDQHELLLRSSVPDSTVLAELWMGQIGLQLHSCFEQTSACGSTPSFDDPIDADYDDRQPCMVPQGRNKRTLVISSPGAFAQKVASKLLLHVLRDN
jgi:hypothetical protein